MRRSASEWSHIDDVRHRGEGLAAGGVIVAGEALEAVRVGAELDMDLAVRLGDRLPAGAAPGSAVASMVVFVKQHGAPPSSLTFRQLCPNPGSFGAARTPSRDSVNGASSHVSPAVSALELAFGVLLLAPLGTRQIDRGVTEIDAFPATDEGDQ